ncbi:MAG: NADPH-dependent oxidoreductase [Pigmentiphaga sp.]|nr:NADPH-dependent oxidoreductase [Pigmentiphaga sp.]
MPDSRTAPAAAWHQRYRAVPEALPAEWNDTLDVQLAHRSVRRFLPREVSDATLATLIAAAQSASSSSNLQVWSVVAVRDADRKARLAEFCGRQRHVAEAPLFLVWLADYARLLQLAADNQAPLEGQEYLEAGVMGCVDAALAAQNAITAAESLGLGGCYIGGIRNQPEAVAAELQLPPGVFPVFGMSLGYPDPAEDTAVKPRLPQAAVLHHETYALEDQRASVAEYESRIAAFYDEQAMTHGWGGRVLKRLAGPQSLTGRHRLREAWDALGFRLR